MADQGLRRARLAAYQWQLQHGWPVRLLVSVAFAGFLAVMALISFPLPWTPVPFSMMPFALLVAGVAQRKQWAALSVLIYLAAGALGANIYAEGESGWRHLVGPTAGYLWGFVAASFIVSWYVERRRLLLDARAAGVVAAGVGALGIFGLVTLSWLALRGTSFAVDWSTGRSILWLLAAMLALAAVGAVAMVRHRHGQGRERLNLFLVMMAAIAAIHIPGVIVLKIALGMAWPHAIAVGSAVFLPFDLIKAGAATGLSTVFLPSQEEVAGV